MWKYLRSRHGGGFKFRRQYEMGTFVLDFYCAAAKVVVEIDGGIHEDRKHFDAVRTAWLESLGLVVIRFPNSAVMSNPTGVVEKIAAVCRERTPPSR